MIRSPRRTGAVRLALSLLGVVLEGVDELLTTVGVLDVLRADAYALGG